MEKEKFLSSIYLIIKNNKNEILLQRRSGTKLWPNFLALPAGHLDKGENAYEAAIREAKEELDITINQEDIILYEKEAITNYLKGIKFSTTFANNEE